MVLVISRVIQFGRQSLVIKRSSASQQLVASHNIRAKIELSLEGNFQERRQCQLKACCQLPRKMTTGRISRKLSALLTGLTVGEFHMETFRLEKQNLKVEII